jgi:hypothetical protein
MADKNFKVKKSIRIPDAITSGFLKTETNGDVLSGSIIPIANGGTGESSASLALTALLPSQSGKSGRYLAANGATLAATWEELYYQNIKNNGTNVNKRESIDFVGFTLSDSSENDTTTISVSIPDTENISIDNKTSSYTLQLSDKNKLIRISSGNITIPADVFSQGNTLTVQQTGTSPISILSSGVTIQSSVGISPYTRNQYSAAQIICVSANTFTVIGDIE